MDKDPICDELRTIVQDEGMGNRGTHLAELASLAPGTIHNLFHGDTRRPQHATVMAIITCLGYKRQIIKDRKLNIDEELVFARAWNKREKEKLTPRQKSTSRKKSPLRGKKRKKSA
jgi:hypothetical protein